MGDCSVVTKVLPTAAPTVESRVSKKDLKMADRRAAWKALSLGVHLAASTAARWAVHSAGQTVASKDAWTVDRSVVKRAESSACGLVDSWAVWRAARMVSRMVAHLGGNWERNSADSKAASTAWQ